MQIAFVLHLCGIYGFDTRDTFNYIIYIFIIVLLNIFLYLIQCTLTLSDYMYLFKTEVLYLYGVSDVVIILIL